MWFFEKKTYFYCLPCTGETFHLFTSLGNDKSKMYLQAPRNSFNERNVDAGRPHYFSHVSGSFEKFSQKSIHPNIHLHQFSRIIYFIFYLSRWLLLISFCVIGFVFCLNRVQRFDCVSIAWHFIGWRILINHTHTPMYCMSKMHDCLSSEALLAEAKPSLWSR